MPGNPSITQIECDLTCDHVEAAFQDFPDAVLITDANQKVLWCNVAFEAMSGFTSGDLHGRSAAQLYKSRPALGRSVAPYESMIGVPSASGIQTALVHKTGLLIEVEVMTWPVLSTDDTVLCYVKLLRDQTLPNKIETARQRMFDILTDQEKTPSGKIDDLLGLACELLCMPIGLVALRQQDVLKVFQSRSTLTPSLKGIAYPAVDNDCSAAIHSPGLMETNEAGTVRPHPLLPGIGVRGSIATRLVVGGEIAGVLSFLTPLPRPPHTPGEKDLVSSIGTAVSHLLAQEAQIHALERAATEDWLTGAASSRQFHLDLDTVFQLVRRNGSTATLILWDVDHFKSVNDSYGHDVGDKVLTEIAGLVQSTIGAQARLYRVGGEEFAIILPGSRADTGAIQAERLRECVATGSAAWTDLPAVTASFGVAELDPDLPGPEAWLKCADLSLYASKNAGRNCVTSNGFISGMNLPTVTSPQTKAILPKKLHSAAAT
ncbi:sensor domain-containing diguanylate cyclase [Sagittula sp. NFXS13]|uniref:sensor domain-containing diguanylate cyclase n=1 Tax=Sagittula sp. NFXS13 TaxID=2819095 RepID=UPI0032E0530A